MTDEDVQVAERPWRLGGARIAWVAWLVVVAAGLVMLDGLHAPTTFFFDEWAFVLQRRGWSLDGFLEPHNGHLSVLPVLAYRALLALVGLDHYHPYRLMGLVVHAVVATGVFVIGRARLGTVVGIAAGAVVLLLGSGWQNVFWPFQIGFMGSVGAAVIAWSALDRRTPRSDALAAIAVGVALGSSGLGISVAVGTLARLIGERRPRAALRVVGVPLSLYLCWYFVYGESQGTSSNVPLLPRFVVNAAGGSVGGLAGRDLLWGHFMAGALLGVTVVLAARRHLGPRILAPAVTVVGNWVLTGYSRADIAEPVASRYVYVGAVFVILVIVELGVAAWPTATGRDGTRSALSGTGSALSGTRSALSGTTRAAVPVAIAVLCIWGNWDITRDGAGGLRSTTAITRGELRAIEWANNPDPMYVADGQRMPQVTAGEYLAAVRELGSAAASDAEIATAPPDVRAEVDRVSLDLLGFRADAAGAPVQLPPGPATGTCEQVVAREDGSFLVTIGDGGPGAPVEVVSIVAAGGPAEVRAKRFGDQMPVAATAAVAAGATGVLAMPADGAPTNRWQVDIRGASFVERCTP